MIAWGDSQQIVSENSESLIDTIELTFKVGPTTDLLFHDNEAMYRRAMKFFAHFCQPQQYVIAFYNYNDLGWAEELIGSLALVGCDGGICRGANSGLNQWGVGEGRVGINPDQTVTLYRSGPLQIHEYTHTVQASAWMDADVEHPQNSSNRASPCWLNEGFPHATGLSVGSNNYEDYLSMRSSEIRGRHHQGALSDYGSDYSTSMIVEYYDNSVPYDCIGKKDYDAGYSVGLLTVEALNAIAGSDSVMNLYTYMATGKDFGEAFQITYGLSWDDAKPILASYVSAVVNTILG